MVTVHAILHSRVTESQSLLLSTRHNRNAILTDASGVIEYVILVEKMVSFDSGRRAEVKSRSQRRPSKLVILSLVSQQEYVSSDLACSARY